MLFDLHVHSSISPCSRLGLPDILDLARSRGLDGVCITDHDTMAAAAVIREGVQPDGLCVIVGMEYATPDGDFLLFGPFEHLRPGLAALDVLALAEGAGGAAVAAHPFRRNRGVGEHVFKSGLCMAMESVNGRNSPGDNAKTALWRNRYSPFETGGSDAHTPEELGRAATRFSAPVAARADLIAALRAGLCRPEIPAPILRLAKAAAAAD